jgi:hypothetical protein
MEDTEVFEKWLEDTLKAGKEKLEIQDSTIAYILLQKGLNYYLKSLCKPHLKEIIK